MTCSSFSLLVPESYHCVCVFVWLGGRSGGLVGVFVQVSYRFLVSDLVSMTGLSEFNCVCVRGMGAWVGVYV